MTEAGPPDPTGSTGRFNCVMANWVPNSLYALSMGLAVELPRLLTATLTWVDVPCNGIAGLNETLSTDTSPKIVKFLKPVVLELPAIS